MLQKQRHVSPIKGRSFRHINCFCINIVVFWLIQILYVICTHTLKRLYSSPNIVRVIKSRRMRWAGHVARMGEGRGVYRVLVGKPEGKRPLGRPRRRWEDNIRMDLQEVGLGYEDWIGLAQDRDRWRARWVRWGTFGFHKTRGISWPAAN